MASKSTSVEAMIFLLVRSTVRSREMSNVDIDTTVLALQTLELLAIESPSLVASQVWLLLNFFVTKKVNMMVLN